MTAVCLAVLAALLVAGPAAAQTEPTATTVAPPPPPKAWILVDADTGAVIDGANDREPLPVASLVKILTALVAVDRLPPDASVPVSTRAEGMPARKISMKAGEVWELEHVLHALLLSSANDAAVAIAERVSGTVESFGDDLSALAADLGLSDDPLLQDPSGLDDEFSVGGGNLISARDLAIATRALLEDPVLAAAVATNEYRFFGGDEIHHRLLNHNRLLRTYPGGVGVKTGYTKRSRRCLVAAAERDGRTMIAVVIDAVDTYGSAAALLDRGFATTGEAQPVDRLVKPEEVPVPQAALAPMVAPSDGAGGDEVHPVLWGTAGLMGTVALLRLRARRRLRRRKRAAAARRRQVMWQDAA